jgi:hypothetical protein
MMAAVLDRPRSLFEDAAVDGSVTLAERLDALLDEARTAGATDCPMCHGRMAHARTRAREEAVCGRCGTRLS